jgi:Asp-tRNA(Asn)/Glu-tRNA(Gln) amidotransferase A subunit family amidase
MTDLWELDITELGPLLRERKVSPIDLTDAYLDRIERVDPRLNTYIRVLPEQARAAS